MPDQDLDPRQEGSVDCDAVADRAREPLKVQYATAPRAPSNTSRPHYSLSINERHAVAGQDDARGNDRRVKPAQAPSIGLRVACLYLRVVHRRLDAAAVHVERAARSTYLRQLNRGITDPQALSQAQVAPRHAHCGEILAKGAGIEGESLGDELVDPFAGDEENRLVPAPVERIAPLVADDTGCRHMCRLDRHLRNATLRDADLHHGPGHGHGFFSGWRSPATLPSVSKKYATVPTVGMWNFCVASRPPFCSTARSASSMLTTSMVFSKPIIFCPAASSRRSCKAPGSAPSSWLPVWIK